jgi:hypothetical protein
MSWRLANVADGRCSKPLLLFDKLTPAQQRPLTLLGVDPDNDRTRLPSFADCLNPGKFQRDRFRDSRKLRKLRSVTRNFVQESAFWT